MKFKHVGLVAALVLFLVVLLFAGINFYSFIFARTVEGEIIGVERIVAPTAVISGMAEVPKEQLFSFAVAIRDKETKEIVTGSSEDRQWAVAPAGKCAQAKFYPYPPWNLAKAGTYSNVRLIRLEDCPNPAPK